jgi:hypothetical protein
VLVVEGTTVRLRAAGREVEVAREQVIGILIYPKTGTGAGAAPSS